MKTTLMITIFFVLMASPWPLREKLKELTYEAIAERASGYSGVRTEA